MTSFDSKKGEEYVKEFFKEIKTAEKMIPLSVIDALIEKYKTGAHTNAFITIDGSQIKKYKIEALEDLKKEAIPLPIEQKIKFCPFCNYEFTITEITSDISSHFYHAHALTKRQSVDFSRWLRKLLK